MSEGRDDNGRFIAGASGNPKGRPKSKVRGLLRESLDWKSGEETNRYRLVRTVWAIFDDPLASYRDKLETAKWIVDQCDGKLPQAIRAEADGEGGGISIVFKDAPKREEPD